MSIAFISGHLKISEAEFAEHYTNRIDDAIKRGHQFVVGDASGVDSLAQEYLRSNGVEQVTVYHMFTAPRNNPGYVTNGGYQSDDERDSAMTHNSHYDITWVRPGRENSGTAKNIERRMKSDSRRLHLDWWGKCRTCRFWSGDDMVYPIVSIRWEDAPCANPDSKSFQCVMDSDNGCDKWDSYDIETALEIMAEDMAR